MKKKILIIGSILVVLVFGILYTSNSNLIADDKDGKSDKKDCSSSCTKKTGTINSTDQVMSGAATVDDKDTYAVYEFQTDKIHCDACKTEMSGALMGIPGVKEISYGETNADSKQTGVKVFFAPADTTPENIAASVKEKELQGKCSNGSKCDMKKKTEKKL